MNIKITTILIIVLSLTSCLGMKEKNVGEVKEKFITSDRSGNPRYFVITDSGSYCLSPEEYASLDTGEVYYEKDFYLEH